MPCAIDGDRISGFCFNGACQEYVGNGEPCTGDGECISGMCNSGVCTCYGPPPDYPMSAGCGANGSGSR